MNVSNKSNLVRARVLADVTEVHKCVWCVGRVLVQHIFWGVVHLSCGGQGTALGGATLSEVSVFQGVLSAEQSITTTLLPDI